MHLVRSITSMDQGLLDTMVDSQLQRSACIGLRHAKQRNTGLRPDLEFLKGSS
jgi:hypothetical protein